MQKFLMENALMNDSKSAEERKTFPSIIPLASPIA